MYIVLEADKMSDQRPPAKLSAVSVAASRLTVDASMEYRLNDGSDQSENPEPTDTRAAGSSAGKKRVKKVAKKGAVKLNETVVQHVC